MIGDGWGENYDENYHENMMRIRIGNVIRIMIGILREFL